MTTVWGRQHAYLVFEFIDGYTLRDVINQRGALSPRQALDLLDPVVEGLAAAHNASLVHRDVKPENVLISRQGWVKIGDFGLSRAVTTNTNTGTLLGTVGYIAPELAQGHNGDARSDIYSAGIMLYELLTGVQPFRGTMPVAVVMAHIQDEVPAPSLAVPGLPPVMDELVRYMTEKDPDHRPANGAALLEDLRHIRQTLTPAELDFGGTAVDQQRPLRPRHQHRGHFPGHGSPVPRCHQRDCRPQLPHLGSAGSRRGCTPRMPAPMRTTPGSHSTRTSAPVPTARQETAPGPALSKRQASAEAKARAKAAATPQKSLGPKNPRRRALLWSLLVVVLAIIAGIAGWFLALGPGALSTVPDVHNKTVAQAQELLHAQGFELLPTSNVFDEKVAAGFVVATDPGAGASIRKFQSVTVESLGGPCPVQGPHRGRAVTGCRQETPHGRAPGRGQRHRNLRRKGSGRRRAEPGSGRGQGIPGQHQGEPGGFQGPQARPGPGGGRQNRGRRRGSPEGCGPGGGHRSRARQQPHGAHRFGGLTERRTSGNLKAGDTVTLTISKGPRDGRRAEPCGQAG